MQILRQGHTASIYDTLTEINWAITDMCNYKCTYCFGQKPLNVENFSSRQDLQAAVKHIVAMNHSSYAVTFGGGEPTSHPHLQECICDLHESLGDRLAHILIITNGSRKVAWYENLFKQQKNTRLNINFSIHTEHVKLENIIEFTLYCANMLRIHFELMFNPDKRGYVHAVFKKLCLLRESVPFSLRVAQLREPPLFATVDTRYTPDDFAWMDKANQEFYAIAKKSGIFPQWRSNTQSKGLWDIVQNGERNLVTFSDRNQAMRNGLLNFKGMWCTMGTGLIAIDPDGTVRGAQCRLASRSRYNIFKNNPYDDPNFMGLVRCSEPNCGCGANDLIPKFADKDEALEFLRIYKTKVLTKENARNHLNHLKSQIGRIRSMYKK